MKVTRNSRKYARYNVRGLLRYMPGPDAADFQINNIDEISEGGLSFSSPLQLEAGTKLRASLLLPPQDTPVDFEAFVVRCFLKVKKPPVYKIGLRFLNISKENQETVRRAIVLFLQFQKKKAKSPNLVIRLHG